MQQNRFFLTRGYIFLGTVYVFLMYTWIQEYTFYGYLGGGIGLILFGGIGKYNVTYFYSLCIGVLIGCVSTWIHEQGNHELLHITPKQLLTGSVYQQTAPDRRQVVTPLGKILLTTQTPLTPGDTIAFLPTQPRYEKYPSPQAESYKKRLHLKGYQASFTTYTLSIFGHQKLTLLMQIRQYVLDRFVLLSLNPTTQALLRGMVRGDTSSLTRTQLDQFVASGLIHIVAVSGSNIAFVVLLGQFFLRRIPVYPRLILLMFLVFGYASLCGWESSVVRAVCFGLITLGSLLLGRPSMIWSLFWLVAVCMLRLHPDIFWYDRGRRLSFSATGTIILFGSLVTKAMEFSSLYMRWLVMLLVPTVSATLGTLPLLLLFNSSYTLGSILANLLVSLLLPWVMRSTIGALLLGSRTTYIPFVAGFLNRGVATILMLSEITTQLSPILLTTSKSIVIGIVVVVWGGGYMLYKYKRL